MFRATFYRPFDGSLQLLRAVDGAFSHTGGRSKAPCAEAHLAPAKESLLRTIQACFRLRPLFWGGDVTVR